MANDRLIEVISPQSYEAIEKLRKELVEALNATAQWNAELTKTKNLKPSGVSKAFKETTKAIKDTQSAMNGYEKSVEKNRLAEIKLAREREKAFDKYERQLQKEKAAREAQVNKESQLRERLAAQRKREEDAIASQNQKRIEAARKLTVAYEKELFEAQQLKKERKEEAILSSKLATEYQKLEVRMNQLGKAVQSLVAKKTQNGSLSKQEEAELKRLQAEYAKYQRSILAADTAIGRHNRNVGNYRSALMGLGGSLKGLMSAFGVFTGVYLFANAVRDAFKRVRDFDKSMQNLAGVMRTSRKDIKDLEQVIIGVAGKSVRTSNELAQLAESLATLGKSKEDIKQLLKPVTDLSLGLETPAAQAGEFLVMMLNAFGKSTDSAMEFADTIATIRTSTTLDFEKMKDSFAYIAPIARLLNKDLAWTGAMVGVLADNSIKAESAGRLLSTGLIKLANDGLTLDEALKRINDGVKEGKNEYELLSIAGKLFGAQAAKIGVILAQNSDSLEKNAQAIRDNGGALDDLVNQQLESVDAKLKILDSAYEEFVLSIENGNGVISKSFGFVLEGLTNFLNGLSQWNKSAFDRGQELFSNRLQEQGKRYKELGEDAKAYAKIDAENAQKRIDNLKKQLEQETRNLELSKEYNFVRRWVRGEARAAQKNVDDLTYALASQEAILQAANKQLGIYSKSLFDVSDAPVAKQGETIKELQQRISDLNKELLDLDKNDKEGIRTKQKLIKELQKELDAILGTTKARQAQLEALKGTVSYFNQLISKLEEQRDKTARTKAEYDSFNLKISQLKYEVNLLNGEWDKWLRNLEVKPRDHDFSDAIKSNVSALEAENSTLLYNAAIRAKRARDIAFQNEMIADAFVRFGGVLGIQETTVRDLFSGIKDGFSDAGEAAEAFGSLAIDAIGSLNAAQNAQIDAQIANLQKQKEVEMAFAGDSARAREEIEARYQRKIAQLKKRQAENDKRAAIATAGINTAVAVTKTFAELGFPAGVLAASIIAALGAAQIAFIASQPIPEFAEGVRDFEGGKAIVGDGGKHEPITDDRGRLIGISPNRPTLVELPRGANVYSDFSEFEREMNAILGGNNISPLGNAVNSPVVVYHGTNAKGMNAFEMRKIMRDTLGNMPRNVLNIDQNGINAYAQKQYGKGQSLNNRVTFKGIDV